MILYFSATGNSLLVARAIQDATGDELISLRDYIKNNMMEIKSERPVVIVCPIHVWEVPRFIQRYLSKVTFVGTDEIYYVVTCRREAGNSETTLKKFCDRRGWKLRGIGVVKMPFNYIMAGDVDEPLRAKQIIQESIANIKDIAEKIAKNEDVQFVAGRTGYKVTMFNQLYRTYYVNAGRFMVDKKACDGCGLCAQDCPAGTIVIKNGRPAWKYACTHCSSCINNCPKRAINYGQITKRQMRYKCPYDTVDQAEQDLKENGPIVIDYGQPSNQ